MALPPSSTTRPPLADLLQRAGVVDETQLEYALKLRSSWLGFLGKNLAALGYVDERQVTEAVSRETGLPVIDLDATDIAGGVTHLLPLGTAGRYGLCPLGIEPATGHLRLACGDPTYAEAVTMARKASGLECDLLLAAPSAIDRAIRRSYYGESGT